MNSPRSSRRKYFYEKQALICTMKARATWRGKVLYFVTLLEEMQALGDGCKKGHFAIEIHETAFSVSFVFTLNCICFPVFKYLLSSPVGIAFVLFDLEKRPLGITVVVYEQESDKARA